MLAACGPASSLDDPGDSTSTGEIVDVEPRHFEVAKQLPSTGIRSELLQWWADEITRRSGGAYTFKFYWSGSLLGPQDMIEGVASGVADIGLTSSGYEPARTPLFQVIDLPYNHRDYECGTAVSREFMQDDPDLKKEFEGNGMRPLLGYTSGIQHHQGTSRINDIEDFDGQRIRVFGTGHARWMQELGADPVAMPLTDIFESLDRGVIDSALLTSYLVEVLGAHQPVTHVGLHEAGTVVGYTLFMNLDTWNDLPQEGKDLFTEVGLAHDEQLAERMTQVEQELHTKFQNEYDIEVYEFRDEVSQQLRSAADRAIESWLDEMEQDGHPARAVHQRWNERIAECEGTD